MIHVKDIAFHAPAFRMDGVSFIVPAGKYAVLMGRTGVGKTTLLEIICGLRRPQSGHVLLGNQDVTIAAPGERGIGYVPQDAALFPTMAVREQIGFSLKMRRVPANEIHSRAQQLAEETGIAHLLDRKPQALSGGEKQRVALARAMAARPSVLLLDEPLSSLDEATQDDLIGLLQRTQLTHQITVLHVTHSRREADALGEVRLLLENGLVRDASN